MIADPWCPLSGHGAPLVGHDHDACLDDHKNSAPVADQDAHLDLNFAG